MDPETDKTVDLEIREKEGCAEASDPRINGVHEPRIKCAGPEINSYQDPEIVGASEPEVVVQELALEEAEVVEVDPEIEELTKPRIDEDVGAAAAGQEEPGRACAGTRVSLGVDEVIEDTMVLLQSSREADDDLTTPDTLGRNIKIYFNH